MVPTVLGFPELRAIREVVVIVVVDGIVDLQRGLFRQNRFYIETKLKTDLATELKNLFMSIVSDRHITTLIRK